MKRVRLYAAAICALASSGAGPAAAQAQITPENKAAFEKIVREYILENPEIIVEAIEKLRSREQTAALDADRQLVAANRAAIFEDPNSFVGGNPKGDVTLVEFFDYRCGVCKRVHPIVEKLVESDGKIRRIYKEWPILGPDSVLASRAAIAARKQGKYLQLSEAMMKSHAKLDEARIFAIAKDAGLDVSKLKADMSAPETEDVIKANYALAEQLKLNGTPTFVIGDTLLRGGRDLETLQAIVAEARAAKN